LFKETPKLGGSEGGQRCQFDPPPLAVFKQNGQHDHISRTGLETSRERTAMEVGADR